MYEIFVKKCGIVSQSNHIDKAFFLHATKKLFSSSIFGKTTTFLDSLIAGNDKKYFTISSQ